MRHGRLLSRSYNKLLWQHAVYNPTFSESRFDSTQRTNDEAWKGDLIMIQQKLLWQHTVYKPTFNESSLWKVLIPGWSRLEAMATPPSSTSEPVANGKQHLFAASLCKAKRDEKPLYCPLIPPRQTERAALIAYTEGTKWNHINRLSAHLWLQWRGTSWKTGTVKCHHPISRRVLCENMCKETKLHVWLVRMGSWKNEYREAFYHLLTLYQKWHTW